MNQQLISDINICHWLQSYEKQLVNPSKFTIIGFYRGNGTALNTAAVVGNTQLLRPTGNTTNHISCAFHHPSNTKFVSVEVTMEFEDLAKAPYQLTPQTFFQLPIKTRQTQTNAYDDAVEDLTIFWEPDNLRLMQVDDFAAMVLLTSRQVGAVRLNEREFGMADASFD